jgi:hypothetical protein
MDQWIWTSAQAKEANYGHSSCFAAAGSSDVASAFQSDASKEEEEELQSHWLFR